MMITRGLALSACVLGLALPGCTRTYGSLSPAQVCASKDALARIRRITFEKAAGQASSETRYALDSLSQQAETRLVDPLVDSYDRDTRKTTCSATLQVWLPAGVANPRDLHSPVRYVSQPTADNKNLVFSVTGVDPIAAKVAGADLGAWAQMNAPRKPGLVVEVVPSAPPRPEPGMQLARVEPQGPALVPPPPPPPPPPPQAVASAPPPPPRVRPAPLQTASVRGPAAPAPGVRTASLRTTAVRTRTDTETSRTAAVSAPAPPTARPQSPTAEPQAARTGFRPPAAFAALPRAERPDLPPDASGGAPVRVFVHVSDPAEAQTADEVRARLNALTIDGSPVATPPLRFVSNMPRRTEVRCLKRADCPAARRVAVQVARLLGEPVAVLDMSPTYGNDPGVRPGSLELWLPRR